jgi:hypothetical protein
MSRRAPKPKKKKGKVPPVVKPPKKKGPDLRVHASDVLKEIFTRAEKVVDTGREFSWDNVLKEYELTAIEAQQGKKLKAKPRKSEESDILGELIFKRVDTAKARINSHMTQEGLANALELAEDIELASQGKRKLRIRDWVEV